MGESGLDAAGELTKLLGADQVSTQRRDLARYWASAPNQDAFVLKPGTVNEIAAIVELANAVGAIVSPVGTASQPCPARALIERPLFLIDLKRLNHIVRLDETSLIAEVQVGVTGIEVERALLLRGLTLGDYPPATLRSTIGGMLSVRTGGKTAPKHGALEAAVLGISAVLPTGQVVHTPIAPRRATGPDLARAILGAEGSLGVLTSVTLRVHRRAETRLLAAYRFPTMERAFQSVLDALRADALPTAIRVSNAEDANAQLGPIAEGNEAILTVATSGAPELASVDRDLFSMAAANHAGEHLGTAVAEIWWKRRTGHKLPGPVPPPPALQINSSLSNAMATYSAIRKAAAEQDRKAHIHLSRFDRDGTSHYVTIFSGVRAEPSGPVRQAIEDAAYAVGGVPVGWHDRSWTPYLHELRRALDPNGVFNPYVLFNHETDANNKSDPIMEQEIPVP